MTQRSDIDDHFLEFFVMLAEMDLGARGTLMTETVILAKQNVLEIYDGPEIPERDNNVALAKLMNANRECDRLRAGLNAVKQQILTLVPDEE